MAAALDADNELHLPSFGQVVLGLIAGIGFIVFNFPIGLERLGSALGAPILGTLGSTAESSILSVSGASLAAQTITFDHVWSVLVIAVLAYLAALLLLSLRHLRLDLFGAGATSLAVGAGSLHLLAWALFFLTWLLVIVGIVLLWVLSLLFTVFGWLFHVIGVILGFLWMVLSNFVGFLFASGWWIIVAVVLAILLIVLAIRNREALLEFLGYVVLPLGIVVGATFLLIKLWKFLGPLLARLFAWLAPVFAFLGRVFDVIVRVVVFLLIVFGIAYLIYGLGSFLLDQFRAGWNSGNGRRGVIIGSLAVGTAVSLILVESNLFNVVSYFPPDYVNFIATNLHHSNPIVDVLTAILIVAISVIGILRNLPRLLKEPGVGQFQTAMVMVGVGLIVGAGLILAASATGDGGSGS